MLAVYMFFSDDKSNGYSLASFKADWQKLSDKDKDQLKTGVENGTLTY